MEERFELIREEANRKIDQLMHKLDTVYTPTRADRQVLKNLEEVPQSKEVLDLKTRHKMQEEALKKQKEEQ